MPTLWVAVLAETAFHGAYCFEIFFFFFSGVARVCLEGRRDIGREDEGWL